MGAYQSTACSALLAVLLLGGCKPSERPPTAKAGGGLERARLQGEPPPEEFVSFKGGTFTMGSDEEPHERPAHPVHVGPFSIAKTEVTNAQFARFVEATKYVTTAERAPDWEQLRKQLPEGTPKPPSELMVPGSMVFVNRAWTWTAGADWRHPEGPKSSIAGRQQHPVVHVSWDDAAAYAKWAGARLPTEAEWEFAARSGVSGHRFTWGDEWKQKMANTWEGDFPVSNTLDDGAEGTAPVRSYPPNAAGLYDMAGNVWEWTADRFREDTYAQRADGGVVNDPRGPDDPNEARRVIRGGSFLCAPNYCASFRTSARRSTTQDSSLAHLGFRIAK